MKGILLAAGRGSRLRPYTDDKPKPLVELGGKPLLDRQLSTLDAAGVTDVTVVTGYESTQITRRCPNTVHNSEWDRTEMLYSLFCARDAFPDGQDLLISYGDIVCEERLVRSVRGGDGDIVLPVDRNWEALWSRRFEDPLDDAETLRMDDSYRIEEIGRQPDSLTEVDAQYTGLVAVAREMIPKFVGEYDALGDDVNDLSMTGFLHHLIERGWDVRAVPVDNGWIEVDTISDLELYRGLYESGSLDQFVTLD